MLGNDTYTLCIFCPHEKVGHRCRRLGIRPVQLSTLLYKVSKELNNQLGGELQSLPRVYSMLGRETIVQSRENYWARPFVRRDLVGGSHRHRDREFAPGRIDGKKCPRSYRFARGHDFGDMFSELPNAEVQRAVAGA